jgi:hypothetical protein
MPPFPWPFGESQNVNQTIHRIFMGTRMALQRSLTLELHLFNVSISIFSVLIQMNFFLFFFLTNFFLLSFICANFNNNPS